MNFRSLINFGSRKKQFLEAFLSSNLWKFVPFLVFTPNIVFSQDAEIIKIAGLKAAYPDDKVVINFAKTTYTFDLNTVENPFVVIEESESQYVSLRSNTGIVESIFYDRNSEVLKHTVRGNGTHKPIFDRRCGNYEKQGIFYHDAQVCQFRMQFEKEGEEMSLKTTKKTYDPRYFTQIHLAKSTTINRGVAKIYLPETVDLELFEMNFEHFEISKTVENTPQYKIIEYKFERLPSFTNLDNLPSFSCALPYVLVQIKSYRRSQKLNKVISDKNDLFDWMVKQVHKVEISGELSDFTTQLTNDKQTTQEKIETVYSWINDKIRYIAFTNGTAGYIPEDPNMVFRKKYGDCKGMAILAKTMLKQLGFDARLAWVYSGEICFSDDVVSPAIHNHMICALKLDNRFLYIDPTATYNPFYELPESIQGRSTVIENGESWILENIPPTDYSFNYFGIDQVVDIVNQDLKIEGNIMLKGDVRQYYTAIVRSIPDSEKNKIAEFFITRSKAGFKVDSIKTTDNDNLKTEFEIYHSLTINNAVVGTGNKIFVNLDYLNDFKDSNIDTIRKYPYKKGSRRLIEYTIHLNIPDGYTLKKLPQPIRIDHPKFLFEIHYELNHKQLVYHKSFIIKNSILYPEDFDAWNDAIDKLKTAYREMLTFEKQ